jgi:Domain of unknown function (DUF4304)
MYPAKPRMSQSPKAVISSLLNAHVTPPLKEHGFHKKGRTYYRDRGGYQQLINIQAHSHNSFEGGSFTVNLGLFSPELYDVVYDEVLAEPAQEQHCFLRYRISQIGEDGWRRADWQRDEWWEFDHPTDLEALGVSVADSLRRKALSFFEHLPTAAAMIEAVRQGRHQVDRLTLAVLAKHAGDTGLAQQIVDEQREGNPHPWMKRNLARIATRLGLSFPAPGGEHHLIVTFRVPAHLSVSEQNSLFWSIINELPRPLPHGGPDYFDRMRYPEEGQWEAHYFGADPERIVAALQPLLRSLEPKFAGITTRVLRA